jgi:AcrR family transcriptional regulator
MPRSDPAPSRQRMLEAAIELMRGYGLAGAGINDLVRASGAPKGSVYHFFPDGKAQIASEALELYAGRVEQFIEAALSGRRDPPARVRALFDAFAQRAKEGGFRRSCAIGTVSLDLGDELEPLQAQLAAAFERWAATIAAHFDLGSAPATHSFAGFVLTAIEGAYVRSRAERSPAAFKEAGAWLARLVGPPDRP